MSCLFVARVFAFVLVLFCLIALFLCVCVCLCLLQGLSDAFSRRGTTGVTR